MKNLKVNSEKAVDTINRIIQDEKTRPGDKLHQWVVAVQQVEDKDLIAVEGGE